MGYIADLFKKAFRSEKVELLDIKGHGTDWSNDEIAYMKRATKKGIPDLQIARKLCRSKRAVQQKRYIESLPQNGNVSQ